MVFDLFRFVPIDFLRELRASEGGFGSLFFGFYISINFYLVIKLNLLKVEETTYPTPRSIFYICLHYELQ